MTDAVLTLRLQAQEDGVLDRLELDGQLLRDLLDESSWDLLAGEIDLIRRRRALSPTPTEPLVLFTGDGRTLEAEVRARVDAVTVEIHDITRHVDDAAGFAKLALQVHRRNRDLQTLYETTAALNETLDLQALVQVTADALGGYLAPRAVMVEAAGQVARWDGPWASEDTLETVEERGLMTARGPIGSVRWWRDEALTEDEIRVLEVVIRKAATSIDHALLLLPAPAAEDHDEFGLLTGPAARRALAGFVRPFAVALVTTPTGSVGEVGELARVLAPGRAGDVKALWGTDRVLVALAGAGVEHLQAWLARIVPDAPIGVALVEHDIDGAIDQAARNLDSA